MESSPAPNYRAVLIGIDDYPRKPLNGCVNDIDQIERILSEGLGVPPERITRFAAPQDGTISSTRLSSLRPTRDEIRNFLNSLADEVGPTDLVFLYYSGHGSRVTAEVNGQRIAREVLIPVDHWNEGRPQRLLYDFELNCLLARIADRAGDLTVVLDCCRGVSMGRNVANSRYLEIGELQNLDDETLPGLMPQALTGLLPAGSIPMLVKACRAGEVSWETRPEKSPRSYGAFTFSLIQALDASERPLSDLRWSDLWSTLLDNIGRFNFQQNPQLVGRWERRVFGGPWTPKEIGYVIRQNGDHFRIEAGTLMGLSEGAKIAVYGPEPDLLPERGSPADYSARIGLLRVERADSSFCLAVSTNGSLRLPWGARGRLVVPGEPDYLVVALDPFDTQLAASLAAWSIVGVPPETPEAEARLRRQNGKLHLGDQIYGRNGQPPLASFSESQSGLAEVVLDHYTRYCQALRLPYRCRDLAGALEVRLLDCSERQISPEDLQAPGFNELPSDCPWRYKVREGNRFVIQIKNRAKDPLEVFVLNCADSGQVKHLGSAQIPVGAMHVLWSGGKLGTPFYPTVATGRTESVYRLIVVGTTLQDQDLSYLEVDDPFADAIQRFPDRAKDMGTRSLSPIVEKWTAEMVTVRIYK